MHMSDERLIDAPPETVWAALTNAEVLKTCVPGAQEVTGTPEEAFDAVVVQKVGPVKATFKGRVELSDMVEPSSLTLSGEGKGGAAGFAKGGAKVTLTPEGTGTRLGYDVDAKVGGKLAQLGSRLIDGFAKKMADQFFANLQQAVEDPAEEGAEAADEAPDAAKSGEKKKGWFARVTGR